MEARVGSGRCEASQEDDIWKRKCLAMQQLCEGHRMMNKHLAKRIKDINRLIEFAERDKSLLVKKYRRHGGSVDHLPSSRDVGVSIDSITSSPIVKPPVTPGNRPKGSAAAATGPKKAKAFRPSKKQKTGEAPGGGRKGSGRADRKERDPLLPKKPSNPFFWFCQEHRAMVQEQCAKDSSSGHHELTKALARMWNDTEGEEKKKYRSMYEDDKLRYAREMEDYVARYGQDAITKHSKAKTPAR